MKSRKNKISKRDKALIKQAEESNFTYLHFLGIKQF